ncbi:hypothetical protein LWC34_12405 [Kibdelosporangium philippinense]|uniref:Uncharacterized protein n=1 Tax=Kibdelosporangium philippinense TaxID=211113 RepID=A0ABS8Z888_9PSEU|nr:hypothetical protein [Kibdelosporangium philippinense]MCE7003622.1 hypothetical protein [Kibdelosporangium philippinense]
MKASHTRGVVSVMRLAEDAGLSGLADELVRLGGSVGANAGAKISTIS